jgi:hypothetical protein
MARAINQVIHPVDVSQQGGFSTPGWANEGGGLLFRDIEIQVVQGLCLPVEEIEVLDLDEFLVLRIINRFFVSLSAC